MRSSTNSLPLGSVIGIAMAALPAVAQETEAAKVAETQAVPTSTFLLVELLGPAKMIGFPAVCPGTSPEDDQSQIICMAELYEAPARVLKNLGGEKTKRRLNIRFTAHSYNAVWRKDVRFVLGVVPFEDKGRTGHFAWYWDWEDDKGEFCTSAEDVDGFDEPIRDFYLSGRIRTASARDSDWSRGWRIACTEGQRRWRLNG